MNKKTTGIIAYITWIGWIVAFCAGDKEGRWQKEQNVPHFIMLFRYWQDLP